MRDKNTEGEENNCLTEKDVQKVIAICQDITGKGTPWCEKEVMLPNLLLDCEKERESWLGRGNPAIFVSAVTFDKRKKSEGEVEPWKVNQTLLLSYLIFHPNWKIYFKPIEVLGIIVHETGHAYNVAAGIDNTEANAYLFEMYVMKYLYENRIQLLDTFEKKNYVEYFESRMSQYRKAISNTKVKEMINDIKTDFSEDNLLVVPEVKDPQFATSKDVFFGSPKVIRSSSVPENEEVSNVIPGYGSGIKSCEN